jgi:hypothetical protein
MNFLADLSETQFTDIQNLGAEFPHLEAATKEPIQQVTADLAQIKKGLVLVEKELGQFPPDSNDKLKTLLTVRRKPTDLAC